MCYPPQHHPPRGARFARGLAASACAVVLVSPLAYAQSVRTLALASANAPDDADARVEFRRRIAGLYRLAPGSANELRRDAAIERSAAPFFVLIRPIAVGRMTEGNPVPPSVRIAFYDGLVDVATPPVSARSPDDGRPATTVGFNGEVNHLAQYLNTRSLLQTTWTSEGTRTTLFTLDPAATTLTLHVLVRSPQLSIPIAYVMSYVRTSR